MLNKTYAYISVFTASALFGAWLVGAGYNVAQEPLPISGKLEVQAPESVDVGRLCKVTVASEGLQGLSLVVTQVRGRTGDALASVDRELSDDELFGPVNDSWVFAAADSGVYVARALAFDGQRIVRDTALVKVKGPVTPVPVDPPPPDVDPPPTTNGWKVLILREEDDEGRIPREQLTAMFAGEGHKYMNSKCAKDSDGGAGWRIWDDDYSENSKKLMGDMWRGVYERAIKDSNGKRPWLYVTDGKKQLSVEFPANTEKWLKTLKDFVR